MAGESGPVEVRLNDCQCPGNLHPDGDILWFRSRPDANMGLAAQVALRQSGSYRGDAEAAVLSVLIRYGVVAWTCRNADGPVAVTTDAVLDRLGWGEGALTVATKARELYWDAVIDPLVPTKSEPPPPTPGDSSTSQNPDSGPATRTSSAPSSRSAPAAGKRSPTTGA